MCGIAGYVGPVAPDAGRRWLGDAAAALAHRGPDGQGLWQGEGVGLAHRRLAIIDLEGGLQPMSSADGRFTLVFNGEIYNHKELRRQLTAAGYAFRTRSDTEVIPAALDHWGVERGLRALRGMFAIALWDSAERALLLARDGVGLKPLYVGRHAGALLFGSEPKALLGWPGLSRRSDPVALLDFFTVGHTLPPRTAFEAIRELEPGTWLRVGPSGETSGRFWAWEAREEPGQGWLDRAEAVLADSVVAHLESDVPVASFLSGGVDSSVLVALLARSARGSVDAFTVGFDDPTHDEAPFAREVAGAVGVRHHLLRMEAGQGDPAVLQSVMEQFDQPFGDSSALPTWAISREMSRHVKVVLSGDGGDEAFAGYPRWVTARRLARVGRLPLAGRALRAASGLARPFAAHRARQLGQAAKMAGLDRARLFTALWTYFDDAELDGLMAPEAVARLRAGGPTSDRIGAAVPSDVSDPARQLQAVEIRLLLAADYLKKVDVASSAHGLEVRAPYLDRDVLAFAASVPLDELLRGRRTKAILRDLARKLVPAADFDRPKQGFQVPLDRWAGPRLRDWLRDLLGPDARSRAWLRPGAADALLSAFEGGADPASSTRFRVYQRVYMLASFEVWLRRWAIA